MTDPAGRRVLTELHADQGLGRRRGGGRTAEQARQGRKPSELQFSGAPGRTRTCDLLFRR